MSDWNKVDDKNKQDFYIEEVELDVPGEKKVSRKTLEIPVIEARQRRMEAEKNLAPYRNAILVIAIVLIVYGFLSGGTVDVLAKAINKAVLETDELYSYKSAKSFINEK